MATITNPLAGSATAKKKLNRNDYMFKDKTGEELIKKPGDVNGLDFAIRDLKDCTVYLLDHTAQVSFSKSVNEWYAHSFLHYCDDQLV
jgi:hypothetical protein